MISIKWTEVIMLLLCLISRETIAGIPTGIGATKSSQMKLFVDCSYSLVKLVITEWLFEEDWPWDMFFQSESLAFESPCFLNHWSFLEHSHTIENLCLGVLHVFNFIPLREGSVRSFLQIAFSALAGRYFGPISGGHQFRTDIPETLRFYTATVVCFLSGWGHLLSMERDFIPGESWTYKHSHREERWREVCDNGACCFDMPAWMLVRWQGIYLFKSVLHRKLLFLNMEHT